MTAYTLSILPERLVVARFPADVNPFFEKMSGESLWAIIHSGDEITYIGSNESVFANADIEPGWRALQVAGPLDFSLVGVLSELTGILADARISVFVISTFSTDIILVKEQHLESAAITLRKAGCLILEQ